MRVSALLQAVFISSLLCAQGPHGHPTIDETIKAEVSTDLATLFEAQMQLIEQRRSSWLAQAQEAMPTLYRTPMQPVAVIRVDKDPNGFQGWKPIVTGDPQSVCDQPMATDDSFILDFGEHITGYFGFSLRQFDIPVDAPVRLELVFAEVPSEVAEPFSKYPGKMTRSWLQDEIINIDYVPQTVRLPRRYAFRYVKVTVISASRHGKFGFSDFSAEAVTSADPDKPLPLPFRDPREAALDRVSLRTLRNCMQTVFEDGPKRDRRLWLGDVRLQALVNYVSYRNFDLVKRSLYLLAGTATDKGLVATNTFERPAPVRGGNSILDYTALFAPFVLEYLKASGDRKTAEDVWPLVLKQLDFTLEPVSPEGLFSCPPAKQWWLFVDWNNALDRQAPEHAIILYGLKATQQLAAMIDKPKQVGFISEIILRMETAARRHLWDDEIGLFVSGPKRQISWASQAWMVLAGVPTAQQARQALLNVRCRSDAQKPVTPQLHHYVVEALLKAGLDKEATDYLHAYWGGMLDKNADTFWEVYMPGDDFLSPYGSHLINSYCHAWSCTPAYFLRRDKIQ